jgi:hypothetical protein
LFVAKPKTKKLSHQFITRIGSQITVVAHANEGGRYPGVVVTITTSVDADDSLKRLLAERCKWVQSVWPENACSPVCRIVQFNRRRGRFTLRFQGWFKLRHEREYLRFAGYHHLYYNLINHLVRDLTIS